VGQPANCGYELGHVPRSHRSWHRDQYSPIRFWSRAVVHCQLPLGIGPRLCSAGRLEPATRRVPDVYGKKEIRATSPVMVFAGYESWAILYAWTGGGFRSEIARRSFAAPGVRGTRPSQRTRRTEHPLWWWCERSQKPGPPGLLRSSVPSLSGLMFFAHRLPTTDVVG